jgi:hypothetical protein
LALVILKEGTICLEPQFSRFPPLE